MNKKVLIIEGSPRKKGNSDLLCDEFIRGAIEGGNSCEKIYLQDSRLEYCLGCYNCEKTRECIHKDEMRKILVKMSESDIIILASPVYFYSISGQMNTFIDRTLPAYYERSLDKKDFYFIVIAAEEGCIERATDTLYGFTECINGAEVKNVVKGVA